LYLDSGVSLITADEEAGAVIVSALQHKKHKKKDKDNVILRTMVRK
jgi:hypothetical protein